MNQHERHTETGPRFKSLQRNDQRSVIRKGDLGNSVPQIGTLAEESPGTVGCKTTGDLKSALYSEPSL